MTELSSYVSNHLPSFVVADISVRWHESAKYGDAYVLSLGRDTNVYLRPTDAVVTITKLAEAVIAQGETAELEELAASIAAALIARGVPAKVAELVADDAEARRAAADAESKQWARHQRVQRRAHEAAEL